MNTKMEQPDYHAATDWVSHSMAEVYRAKGPQYFAARYVTKTIPDKGQTPQMLMGSLAHLFVLEPDQFDKRYYVAPKIDRRTKEGKADWRAMELHCAENKLELLNNDQAELVANARAMAESILADSEARKYLEANGTREESVFWVNQFSFCQCKAKADLVIQDILFDRPIIADIKTAIGPMPNDFAKKIVSMGYHRQAAHYLDGFATDDEALADAAFVFIAVRNEPPFYVFCYRIQDDLINLGRTETLADLLAIKSHQDTGDWRHPAQHGTTLVNAPAWALRPQYDQGLVYDNLGNPTDPSDPSDIDDQYPDPSE